MLVFLANPRAHLRASPDLSRPPCSQATLCREQVWIIAAALGSHCCSTCPSGPATPVERLWLGQYLCDSCGPFRATPVSSLKMPVPWCSCPALCFKTLGLIPFLGCRWVSITTQGYQLSTFCYQDPAPWLHCLCSAVAGTGAELRNLPGLLAS